MTWVWRQRDGILSRRIDETGCETIIGRGYAGHGEGVNNPDLQHVPNVGPIPRGHYTIGAPRDGGHLGPHVLPLTPQQGTETFGRSGFYVHGDNRRHDQSASEGCLILSRPLREEIAESSDSDLEVVA